MSGGRGGRRRRREAAGGLVTLDLLLHSWSSNATTSCLPTACACWKWKTEVFFVCFFSFILCCFACALPEKDLGTHHLHCRLPVVSGHVEVRSGQAPDLQALQVAAGCQAETRHTEQLDQKSDDGSSVLLVGSETFASCIFSHAGSTCKMKMSSKS